MMHRTGPQRDTNVIDGFKDTVALQKPKSEERQRPLGIDQLNVQGGCLFLRIELNLWLAYKTPAQTQLSIRITIEKIK